MAAPRDEGDERQGSTDEEREAARKILRDVSAAVRRFQALVEAQRVDRQRGREEGA